MSPSLRRRAPGRARRPRRPAARRCLAALCLLSAIGRPAGAAPRPADGLAVAAAGMAGELPAAERLRITGLPLGGRGFVDLEVEAFDLLAPDFRLVRDGVAVPVPAFVRELAVYRGAIAGEPGSRVVLLRTPDGRFTGNAVHEGLSYTLATDGVALLAGPDPDEPATLEECRLDRPAPGLPSEPAVAPARRPRGRQPLRIPAGIYGARVLVEAHHDLLRSFLGNEQRVVEELVRVFAAVSTRLEDGIAVRLQVAGIGLHTQPAPPWSWAEFLRSHPVERAPRSLVYMVNDRAVEVDGGGVLAGLCTAYGPGDYDSGPPRDFGWSWLSTRTIAHEVGHVFGSDHTHCYGYAGIRYGDGLDSVLVRGAPGEPPVDRCWGRDETCYVGPDELLPPGEGSIMSYCPSPSGSYGEPGRHGLRSERVLAILRATVERAAARYPSCLEVLTDAVGLRVESRGPGTATLAWTDVFTGEAAWLLETRGARGWRTARTLSPNATSVALSRAHAKPGATYRLRVRLGGRVSEPSTSVTLP